MRCRQSSELILLRTRAVDEHNRAFAEELRGASGFDVRFLVDERTVAERSRDPDVLSLNVDSYNALGLYTPPDVAWRCGDYGIYLAWREQPDYLHYWLIEDDVRIAGTVADFFQLCSNSDADLVAANLREARRGDFWWPHALSRDGDPCLCLFGAVRLSREAVSRCFTKRKEHSRKINRIALWPNDEGHVATTVVSSGLSSVDFNDLQAGLWDHASFSVTGGPIDFMSEPGLPRLIHPVRFAPRPSDRASQTNRQDAASLRFRARQAAVRRVNALSRW